MDNGFTDEELQAAYNRIGELENLLAVCSFIEDRVELMRAYYGFMRDVHPVTGEALDYE